MKKLKIFLASSEELKRERLEIADLIGHMNLALENEDVRIYLVKWEYLDASMSERHKQEEYNKTLEQCNLCFVLFATRFGKYTESELKTAYDKLCDGDNDNGKLTVFFKNGGTETDELKEFKSTFRDTYPEIPTENFDSIISLKQDFLKVWDRYQRDNLEDKYPVIFTESHATLNGEKLLHY
ncbi:MAG: hypothetical protein K2N48_06585 [Muribaculaceae bacterium]|nr:hypothetical protein [Muribaculaceae bacterium]